MTKRSVLGTLALLLAGSLWAGEPTRPAKALTPATLQAEIEALGEDRVAWRAIAWKSCLLEGLRESRVQHKPLLLWVFIDRPVDDARC
jgi:hypothetical protein